MLDLKSLRQDPEGYERALRRKDPEISLSSILEMDRRSRDLKTQVEQLKAQRNHLSKEIGEKKRRGEECAALMEQVNASAAQVGQLDEELKSLEDRLLNELAQLPNLPGPNIPDGPDRHSNVCLHTFGDKPTASFPFKHHLELNESLGLFDFKRSAKVTGSGWPGYVGMGARLEWALINFMIDLHVSRGYTLWMPPLLVRERAVWGSGQLPKFATQQYKLYDDEYPFYLIPTAEVVLTGLYAEETFSAEDGPLRLCAYTPCFRREAGAAGSAERGLIRMHQFNKVEMYVICPPEQSDSMFDELVEGAELVLRKLGIHHQRMLLCTGDMSFAASKTIDIEVWLPGQNRYYEVSSVSHCTDFQSRRSQIRVRHGDGRTELAHTLNGSGLATSRLMVALLENNQQPDGSVVIPEALRPYLDGIEVLKPQ